MRGIVADFCALAMRLACGSSGGGLLECERHAIMKRMATETIQYGRVTWTNIERVTPQDMQDLRDTYPHFHPLDIEDLQSRIEAAHGWDLMPETVLGVGVKGPADPPLTLDRLPRTAAAALAGASLAIAGLLMQLLTRNRFVEPSTAGTVESAGLGLVLIAIVNIAFIYYLFASHRREILAGPGPRDWTELARKRNEPPSD
mgnify:CR=1 FL=1